MTASPSTLCKSSSPATPAFDPAPELIPRIIRRLLDPAVSLSSIARRYRTTFVELCRWMAQPHVARQIDAVRQALITRAGLIAADHLVHAALSTRDALRAHHHALTHTPARLDNPAHQALLARSAEGTRKCAATLDRIARSRAAPPPARGPRSTSARPPRRSDAAIVHDERSPDQEVGRFSDHPVFAANSQQFPLPGEHDPDILTSRGAPPRHAAPAERVPIRIDAAARFVAPLSALAVAAAASATPTNTTLPGGWSWQPLAGGTYDSGVVGTPRGGFDTQTVPPFLDTSYGVMNESGTPWFTGNDLSAQQYVQTQLFGNFGTGSPPGPSGSRFYNTGYQSTAPGSNFPSTAAERRSVSVNHWNNPFPDAGGVASLNQIIYVPVSASLVVGQGFGADEMQILAIGGGNGQTSRFRADANIRSSWATSAFGGLANANNVINVNGITTVNDPGSAFGFYNVPWGFGSPSASGQIDLFRAGGGGFILDEGVNIGAPGQGIPANSIGVGLSDTYNVLSSILQDGSSFSITFDSSAEIFLSREFGSADARASMGPGMEGNARLIVQWAAFQAVPAPGSAALLALSGLLAARRRR